MPTPDRFSTCLAFTWLPSNDGQPLHVTAKDPGGATSWGVTLSTYSAWRRKKGVETTTVEDLASAPKDELSQLYFDEFWKPLKCDQLPAGLDLTVFDFGVTAGIGASVDELQSALRIKIDGNLGPVTLAAVKSASKTAVDLRNLIDSVGAAQESYYRHLQTFSSFGRGWTTRTTERTNIAKASVATNAFIGAVPMAPIIVPPPKPTTVLGRIAGAFHAFT